MGEFKQITAPQLRFCMDYVSADKTNAQLAKEAGVSEQTLYNWLRKPEIQAKLDEYRAVCDAQLRHKLRRIADKAVDTLQNCLACGLPETARKAAMDIIKYPLGDPSRPLNVNQNTNANTNTPVGEILNEQTWEIFAGAIAGEKGGHNRRVPAPPSPN